MKRIATCLGIGIIALLPGCTSQEPAKPAPPAPTPAKPAPVAEAPKSADAGSADAHLG